MAADSRCVTRASDCGWNTAQGPSSAHHRCWRACHLSRCLQDRVDRFIWLIPMREVAAFLEPVEPGPWKRVLSAMGLAW